MSFMRSVVFPAPLHPASPTTRILSFASSVIQRLRHRVRPRPARRQAPRRARNPRTSTEAVVGAGLDLRSPRNDRGGYLRRRDRPPADLRARGVAGLLLFDPDAVVRPRPGEVDLSRAHGVVGAFHAERADV